MLLCGALTTITPRRVASGTSTLSRPMPARPTTTSSLPASEHLGGDLGGAADDERMRAADGGEQLRQVELHVDLVAGRAQPVEATFGDLFCDEDACHSPIVTGRSHRWEPV